MESSILVDAGGDHVLVDVTRDFTEQGRAVPSLELVLLTHAHRDACGGISQLERWLARRAAAPVPVLASRSTVRTLRRRVRRLDRCRLVETTPGRGRRWRSLTISALEVPHAEDCTTFAWRLRRGDTTVVYASDVARLDDRLRRFAAGADVLVIDGAMWSRALFSHLTIQRALPVLARWRVKRLIFTQLGRSTPDHAELDRWLRRQCPHAAAAFDGLRICAGSHRRAARE
jgi:phosphoribosyl 1,2-cyclic phosphodiesterase